MILAYALARTLTELHDQVAEQAVRDPLTGLWNRRRMFEMLEREMQRATSASGTTCSVLIVDIDDFKSINDELGHLQGDEVLRTIAEIVLQTTRTIDVGARYGGDELALVLSRPMPRGRCPRRAPARAASKTPRCPTRSGGTMSVTVSVGAATATEPPTRWRS